MARTLVVGAIMGALVIAPALAQQLPSPAAMRAFQDGRSCCVAGRNLEAIKKLSEALAESPEYVDALIERGIAYEQVASYDLAVADQSRALSLKPDNYIAYYNRANALFKLKEYERAADDYHKVAELLPQRAREMEIAQGTVYDAAGEYAKAVEQYNAALKLEKDEAITARRDASLQAVKSALAPQSPPGYGYAPYDPVVPHPTGNKTVQWEPTQAGPLEYSSTGRHTQKAAATADHSERDSQMSFLPSQPFSPEAEQATGSKNAQICFLTQVFDPRWNPDGPKRSQNCGPASLAMAYRYFDRTPPGGNTKDIEQFIEATRLAMTGGSNNMLLTNFKDVVRGAQAVGLRTKIVRNMRDIDEVLATGAVFIASGCPNVPGAYGPRFNYRPGTYGHFILVTNKDGSGYEINDPINKLGPAHISREELEAFLSYWPNYSLKGGIAVWN